MKKDFVKNIFTYYRIIPLSFLIVLLVPFFVVFGATNDFIIRTLIGSDVTPPSIPGNVAALPVATTQIDVSWDASTDDLLLSGYHIWRDGLQVATTSSLTYSDTGLTASTTYTYYVTAFDSSFNESASSTVVATTTLSIPVSTSASSGATQGSVNRPLEKELYSIEISPQRDSVNIRYETEGYIRPVVKWGRTSSYEMGSLAEQIFSRFHETNITGLTPSTKYFFTIEGENKVGRYGVIHSGSFMTLSPEDIFPPSNVTNLKAIKVGDEIVLTWTNPKDVDFSKVRVLESNQFYPTDTADGWVLYEGEGTLARSPLDTFEGSTRYYTVFAYDALGNISSGSVVKLYFGEPGTEPPDDIDPSLNEIALTLDDINFSQEGILRIVENGIIYIDGAKQLTISIPYELLPRHLKTILVVIGDSRNSGQTFSFLVRTNQQKTAYVSTIAPFGVSGNFPIQVSVFDFKTAQIGYTNGTLTSYIQSTHTEMEGPLSNFWVFIKTTYIFWIVVALILLMFVGRRLMRK